LCPSGLLLREPLRPVPEDWLRAVPRLEEVVQAVPRVDD